MFCCIRLFISIFGAGEAASRPLACSSALRVIGDFCWRWDVLKGYAFRKLLPSTELCQLAGRPAIIVNPVALVESNSRAPKPNREDDIVSGADCSLCSPPYLLSLRILRLVRVRSSPPLVCYT